MLSSGIHVGMEVNVVKIAEILNNGCKYFDVLIGVASSSGFWQPEKVAQFEDLVLDQTFKATFKSQKPGEEALLCVLESADGTNINQKYGTSTNSLVSTTHDSSSNNFQQRSVCSVT